MGAEVTRNVYSHCTLFEQTISGVHEALRVPLPKWVCGLCKSMDPLELASRLYDTGLPMDGSPARIVMSTWLLHTSVPITWRTSHRSCMGNGMDQEMRQTFPS